MLRRRDGVPMSYRAPETDIKTQILLLLVFAFTALLACDDPVEQGERSLEEILSDELDPRVAAELERLPDGLEVVAVQVDQASAWDASPVRVEGEHDVVLRVHPGVVDVVEVLHQPRVRAVVLHVHAGVNSGQ